MHKPIQHLEVFKKPLGEGFFQVKLNVDLAAEVGAVSQEAELAAVRNESPQVLAAVEELCRRVWV
jgi:hypothetical protein